MTIGGSNRAASLSRRPLTASSVDQRLFVDREGEGDTILAAIRLGLNVFVSGTPGSGKTSLLRHIQATLEADQRPMAYVNVEAVNTVEGAIGAVARALDPVQTAGLNGMAWIGDETDVQVIEDAAASFENQPLAVLVDGASEQIVTTLFGRYRDRLWHAQELSWVVASRQPAPVPPADAFFDRVVELGPLNTAAADDLLARRAAWISPTMRGELVQAIGSAQPLFWMLAAQTLAIADTEQAAIIETLSAQHAAAERLPDRLRTLYEALLAVEPTHAGDERLLERVGSTRPRVVTGLKDLENRGLVRGERDGRRVLYRTLRNALVHATGSPLANIALETFSYEIAHDHADP